MIIKYFKYPVVRQHQSADCGPACLLSLVRYFGGRAYLDKIRLLCHTDYKGCRIYDLKTAAEKLGFKTSAFRYDKDKYPRNDLPVILHCRLSNNMEHFIIVYKVKKERFLVADPAKGLSWLSRSELDKLWQSRVLLTFQKMTVYRDPAYMSDWMWLLSYIKRYEDHVLQIVFCGLVTIFSGFFTAFLMKTITEQVIPGKDDSLLKLSLLFMLIFLLLRGFSGYIRHVLFYKHGKHLFNEIFKESMNYFTRLPFTVISRFTTGEMTSRFLDLFRIQSFYQFTLLQGLTDLCILISSLSVMCFFSGRLAVLSSIFIVLLGILLAGIYPSIRKIQNTMLRKSAAFSHGLIETMEGMDEISAFCANPYFTRLNYKKYEEFLGYWTKAGYLNNRILIFSELCMGFFQLLFIAMGVNMILKGSLSFGNWLASFILTANFIPALFRLMENALKASEAREAITRLRDFLIHPPECKSGLSLTERTHFSLELRNCSFQWPKYTPLFENVNISLRKGQITVITGENGSGKSTLVHSILRQYRFSEGDMFWNETPVLQTDISTYRQKFGLVTQNVKIFNMSLRDNIFLGRKPGNYKWLNDIHRDFNWFFQKFDAGLLTILGEGHQKISGGEKQIVGLIRAVLEEPHVLILDECFNSLDMMTRNWILLWIKSYAEKHAVLMISHDPRICRIAHSVINLDSLTAG
jgi:ATP-binding cassette, subfamily C, bacteriocin exporter